MINLFIFAFGVSVGSFLNVLADRLPKGEDVTSDRSRCDFCRKTLGFWDLVPIFSYLFLLGKCRYCHKKLSIAYLLTEIITGLGFVYIWENLKNFPLPSPTPVSLLFSFFIFSVLLVIFLADLKYLIIPNGVLIPGIIGTIIYRFIYTPQNLFPYLLAGVLGFAFLYLIYLVTKGKGMGFGDVKYALLMGLLLGYPDFIIAFYLAFLTGAAVGVILLLGKKARFGQHIAFGPFLVLSTVITFLCKEKLLTIFLNLLFPG